MMRRSLLLCALAAVLAAASCGTDEHPTTKQAQTAAAPSYPPQVEDVARKILGEEAEVLLYGDLAKNGKQQALIVNRVKPVPQGVNPGTLIVRAAIIQNDGGSWKEVLLCDQHLKNPKGFLGGQPLAPVNGWRLQTEQNPQKGLELYFTPLQKPAGGYIQTFGVRWNPEVKRYQSLDRSFEHFLTEVPTLEAPNAG